jgi:hypothetical protein
MEGPAPAGPPTGANDTIERRAIACSRSNPEGGRRPAKVVPPAWEFLTAFALGSHDTLEGKNTFKSKGTF